MGRSRRRSISSKPGAAVAVTIRRQSSTKSAASSRHGALFRIRTTDLRRAATKVSELQVVYVDANGNVEEVPLEMIGDRNLAANEVRTIPQPDTGNIRFDTPGRNETLVI
ncbi:hypothetical protein HR059_07555 [Sinorhizobium meliloti WSM1022]|uniref:hypothetical protein n=1 Tax=Rhizobium meliloti TaxID=382 RepID=UPI00048073C4|nr:hypothetical protein [Sinorhizobium meliloti]QKN14326.1 hypothetical protein HR059_07555 [Sinorhizobium meliloti WSM1022]